MESGQASQHKKSLQSWVQCQTRIAHILGITSFVLVLIWLLHYREGINYYSSNAYRVFNTHPLLMVMSLILLTGEALMVHKIFSSWERKTKKRVHMWLNLVAFVLGGIGVRAAFKSHGMLGLKNMTSIHSWVGLTTITLFGFQWLMGYVAFNAWKVGDTTRKVVRAWHMWCGRTIFYMAVCAALTGLMEKAAFLKLTATLQHETHVINFLGLAILLFGISVDFSLYIVRSYDP